MNIIGQHTVKGPLCCKEFLDLTALFQRNFVQSVRIIVGDSHGASAPYATKEKREREKRDPEIKMNPWCHAAASMGPNVLGRVCGRGDSILLLLPSLLKQTHR